MPYYAQINEAGRVVAVVETSGPLEGPRNIPVESMDESLHGLVYDALEGTFAPPAQGAPA